MSRLELRQNLKQKLSPQQIQFMKLLQVSNANIETEIKKELEENPALEEIENNDKEIIDNLEEYNYKTSQKTNRNSYDFSRETNISNKESFRENLVIQLNYLELNSNEKIIAKQIIGTLDNDGYLRRDLESIIDDIAFSENIELELEDIKKVLSKIQKLEPPGVGARSLEECLLIQINAIGKLDNTKLIAKEILTNSFDEFIKNKIQSARWFIEALNQRNSTLKKTMRAIIDYQKKFFTDGDENDLRPMILKDISEIIRMDISTVSRIVSTKIVQTDFGIFPLKYFFSESKIKKGEEYVSSKVVKNFLKDVIESEDKKNPLSDELLEKILKKEGFNIARRTITKYREQLNIPVARLRKDF